MTVMESYTENKCFVGSNINPKLIIQGAGPIVEVRIIDATGGTCWNKIANVSGGHV